MWAMLAQVAVKGYELWQEKERVEQAGKDWERQMRVTKTLAAKSLATTYNSIAQKSLEVATQFKRKYAEVRHAQHAEAGAIKAQAAAVGATGRRATLAQKQKTVIPAERQMAALRADAKREQDALIRRADAEADRMIAGLIAQQPDIPEQFDSEGAALDLLNTGFNAYGGYRAREREKDDAIVGYQPPSFRGTKPGR